MAVTRTIDRHPVDSQVEAELLTGAERGIEELAGSSTFSLRETCVAILQADRTAILTGFPVRLSEGRVATESDGPIGAALAAAAIAVVKKPPIVLIDQRGRALMAGLLESIAVAHSVAIQVVSVAAQDDVGRQARYLSARGVEHLLTIERPGETADGSLRNMRGENITALTTKCEPLVQQEWSTSAFADGGNEIGMGGIDRNQIASAVEDGNVIASRTEVDYLTVCGVSNWGAYALVGYIHSLATSSRPTLRRLLTDEVHSRLFDTAAALGAVDGVTKERTRTVDGIPYARHAEKMARLRQLLVG